MDTTFKGEDRLANAAAWLWKKACTWYWPTLIIMFALGVIASLVSGFLHREIANFADLKTILLGALLIGGMLVMVLALTAMIFGGSNDKERNRLFLNLCHIVMGPVTFLFVLMLFSNACTFNFTHIFQLPGVNAVASDGYLRINGRVERAKANNVNPLAKIEGIATHYNFNATAYGRTSDGHPVRAQIRMSIGVKPDRPESWATSHLDSGISEEHIAGQLGRGVQHAFAKAVSSRRLDQLDSASVSLKADIAKYSLAEAGSDFHLPSNGNLALTKLSAVID